MVVGPTDRSMPIVGYSGYLIDPDGTVWRKSPPKRGRSAGTTSPVTPVIHPKGHLWSVFVYNDEGKRVRVPVNKLLALALQH